MRYIVTTRSVSRYETNLIIIDNCFSIASRDICPNASCEKFLNYCITDTIVSVLNNNYGEMNHIHNVPKLQHMTLNYTSRTYCSRIDKTHVFSYCITKLHVIVENRFHCVSLSCFTR